MRGRPAAAARSTTRAPHPPPGTLQHEGTRPRPRRVAAAHVIDAAPRPPWARWELVGIAALATPGGGSREGGGSGAVVALDHLFLAARTTPRATESSAGVHRLGTLLGTRDAALLVATVAHRGVCALVAYELSWSAAASRALAPPRGARRDAEAVGAPRAERRGGGGVARGRWCRWGGRRLVLLLERGVALQRQRVTEDRRARRRRRRQRAPDARRGRRCARCSERACSPARRAERARARRRRRPRRRRRG